MLALSPLRTITKDEIREGEMESFLIRDNDVFADFSGENLLDSIDFDDLFIGINDGDVLPDLEMDPEILAEFQTSTGCEESEKVEVNNSRKEEKEEEEENKVSGYSSFLSQGEEIVSKRDESVADVNSSPKEAHKGRKSSKNHQGKRKVKVDWTPELHRRFVEAVEQLGVDKAVPSRILELMGIHCLTRHNIASHLQVNLEARVGFNTSVARGLIEEAKCVNADFLVVGHSRNIISREITRYCFEHALEGCSVVSLRKCAVPQQNSDLNTLHIEEHCQMISKWSNENDRMDKSSVTKTKREKMFSPRTVLDVCKGESNSTGEDSSSFRDSSITDPPPLSLELKRESNCLSPSLFIHDLI